MSKENEISQPAENDKLDNISNQIEQYRSFSRELADIKSELLKRMEQLDFSIDDNTNNLEQAFNDTKFELLKIKDENYLLTKKIESFKESEQRLVDLENNNNDLKEQIVLKENIIKEDQEIINEHTALIESLMKDQEAYEAASGDISAMKEELETLRGQLEEKSQSLGSSNQKVEELLNEVSTLNEQVNTLRLMEEEINNIKNLEEKIEILAEENQKLTDKIISFENDSENEANEIIQKLTIEKDQLSKELLRVSEIAFNQQATKYAPPKTKKMIDDLEKEKEVLKSKNQTLQDKILEKESRINELLESMEGNKEGSATKELLKLRTKFENIQKNYITVVAQKDELMFELQQLKEWKKNG